MNLVKLEIDGKKVIADSRQTILEVARQHGIGTIPTLCHDDQLEPFASCFLCVVKVKGARTLLPACSTRIAGGMVVETNTPEVRRSRKAALELMLSNHFADCIGPCQLECPAGIDIQGYVALAALGKYADAIQLIKRRNPLPAVCGRVCTRPCEVKGCRRNLVDEPVGIDNIKRYLADVDLGRREPFRPAVAPPNGKKVAVVGGGPAGLSCAYYLAIRGYSVQILENLPEAGGMLRYGIPEYRLPKEVLDLEINQILELGVKLRTNVALGRDFTVASLKAAGYDAVFVGIGAWESSKMRVQDEETPGVLPGIDFLKQYGLRRSDRLSGTVLVVGGGNTAIDCARTALRLGAGTVRLLYRRTRAEMPANDMEIVEAQHEGVDMQFLVAPVRVVRRDGRVAGLECLRMELGEPDSSGRRSPKPIRGSEFVVEGTTVIAAIGQATRVKQLLDGHVPDFLPFGESLTLTRWNTIQVNDRSFETSVDGVFSGGDVVTGAATAIEAIAAGRKAAHAIDAYVRTGKAEPEPVEFCSRKDTFRTVSAEDLRDGSRYPRRPMPALPAEDRIHSFAEVEQGYTTHDLKLESARCLECGCGSLFECDLRRYATEYQADITQFLGEAKQYRVDRTHPLIELDPNKCILCGRCVRICSELVGVAAYGFINRGFNTVVRPSFGGSLLDTDCVTCGLCIGTCPTGAIGEKVPLDKPGPWPTEKVQTICHYCGTGCRLNYETYGDSLIRVSRREDAHPTSGNHCRRGRFGYDYIQAPDRLGKGHVRAGRELQEVPVADAVRYTAMRLKELKRKYAASEMAVFVSPRLTNEEIYLAQKFARVVLGTHQVTSFARLLNSTLDCPEVVSTATIADLVDAQAVLVVGSNIDDDHFVTGIAVKKALRQGGRLIVVSPAENCLSGFADVFLRCGEGAQREVVLGLLAQAAATDPSFLEDQPEVAAALAGRGPEQLAGAAGIDLQDLRAAAEILSHSIQKVLVFDKDYRGLRTPGDERVYARAASALGCGLLAMREKSNMQGLLDLGATPDWLPGYTGYDDADAVAALEREWCVSLRELGGARADVGALLSARKIHAAVVIGEDPLGNPDLPEELAQGLLAVDFLVVMDLFMTTTAASAHVVLPLSAHAETSGTVTNHERRVQRLSRAVPPRGGLETWQIFSELAALTGYRFKMKYGSVAEVTDEIRRAVPPYADVEIDGSDVRSGWPIDGKGSEHAALAAAAVSEPVRPVPTLALDVLETRFTDKFDKAMTEARARLAATPAV